MKSLKRQLNQVIVDEQMENGTTINNNLSVDKIDQQFVTHRRVFQLKQKHLWIEKKLVGHRTPHAMLIIPCEMQTSETQKHANNLQQNSMQKKTSN